MPKSNKATLLSKGIAKIISRTGFNGLTLLSAGTRPKGSNRLITGRSPWGLTRFNIKNWGQLVALLIFTVLAWKLLHIPKTSQPGTFEYLYTLEPDMVILAQIEGQEISPDGWASILAIRSSIPEQASSVIAELKNGQKFVNLRWGNLSKEKIKEIKYRRSILLEYPLYQPQRYTFPVVGKCWYSDTFGANREGGTRKHEGTDLFGPEGTPIISVSSGMVEQIGWNRLGGERVGIRGEDGNYYYYAHLQSISGELHRKDRVREGTILGTMGHTGDALTTPDHLHFGIELPDGTWVNPYGFLKVWEKQV